jgi:cell division protein ZapA
MPLVNVLVNGRAYTVACDEGEEDHVRELGQFLDKHVRQLSGSIGSAGDTRLLLMAGLVIADELYEARGQLEERNKEIAALKAANGQVNGTLHDNDDQVAEALEGAASRIEAIAARLGAP